MSHIECGSDRVNPPLVQLTLQDVIDEGWKEVSLSCDCMECSECGEPHICSICGDSYESCPCPGPTQDGVVYGVLKGVMYGLFVEMDS